MMILTWVGPKLEMTMKSEGNVGVVIAQRQVVVVDTIKLLGLPRGLVASCATQVHTAAHTVVECAMRKHVRGQGMFSLPWSMP